MKLNIKRWVVLALVTFSFAASLFAQEVTKFSIKEAVAFAQKNNLTLQSTRLEEDIANQKVKETLAIGLPQINGGVSYTNNIQIATQRLPNFINAGLPPGSPQGPEFIDAQFGVANSLAANVRLDQLIFDGTYFLGLKAAKEFVKISEYQVRQSEVDVEINTVKAYYAVLMADKRIELIHNNIKSLDSSFYSLKALAREGFIESVDTSRVVLSLSNLNIQKAALEDQRKIMLNVLKLQMGVAMDKEIELTESTESLKTTLKSVDVSGKGSITSRNEYKLLDQQVKLGILDKKRYQMGYFPTVSGFLSHQQNTFAAAGELGQLGDPWFPGTAWGLSLNVPIFSGFMRKSQINQAELRLQQYKFKLNQFEQAYQNEVFTAQTNYLRAVDNYQLTKKNVDLANEIRRIAKIKFQEGLGTSLEYTTAETESNTAEANGIIALYQLMIAELEYRKATGAKIIE